MRHLTTTTTRRGVLNIKTPRRRPTLPQSQSYDGAAQHDTFDSFHSEIKVTFPWEKKDWNLFFSLSGGEKKKGDDCDTTGFC